MTNFTTFWTKIRAPRHSLLRGTLLTIDIALGISCESMPELRSIQEVSDPSLSKRSRLEAKQLLQ